MQKKSLTNKKYIDTIYPIKQTNILSFWRTDFMNTINVHAHRRNEVAVAAIRVAVRHERAVEIS